MAVAFIPPQEFPRTYLKRRPVGTGGIVETKGKFVWYIGRGGKRYRGPRLGTRADATAALEEALAALARGESPVSEPIQSRPGRPRSKTVAQAQLRRELRSSELVVYPEDVKRPTVRADCAPCPTCQDWRDNQTGDELERLACGHTPVEAIGHSRPCLFIGCTRNNYLEETESGGIKFLFPHIEPGDMKDSCSSDLADEDGVTPERAGAALNVTRERVRQLEERGLKKIKAADRGQLGLPPERETYASGKGPHSGAP